MVGKRWQVVTLDTRTGDKIYTTQMPDLGLFGQPGLDYRYETCWFGANGDSYVQDRYDTQEEAELGHWKTCERMFNRSIT